MGRQTTPPERAGELPDYRKGENFRLYEGLEDLYWTYRARLPEGENVFLVSGGIDYKYRVFSEDVTFYEYEGMQKPFEADVSAAADGSDPLATEIPDILLEEADRPAEGETRPTLGDMSISGLLDLTVRALETIQKIENSGFDWGNIS